MADITEYAGNASILITLNDVDLTYTATIESLTVPRGDPWSVTSTQPTRGAALRKAASLARHEILLRTRAPDEE